MPKQPSWITAGRKARLAKVAVDSVSDLVSWQVDLSTGEFTNPHYDIDSIIQYWRSEDRETARLAWRMLQREIHSLGEPRAPIRGHFNNISRDIWADKQPLFYVEAIGMSALTLKPYALVKLNPNTFTKLQVDLGDSLRKVSKNRRHKALRYGKPLPPSATEAISRKVSLAVRDYLK